ncbi:DUF4112 domain-containing protein [Paraglaciecola psychrophila]|jgi:hypothetical protein|uniref:DUF4112 domain-containing protein n=1 Tax=Paraglaciecola psychrophila 170 TaxID=1129794 RepID=K7A0W9_9ALTE|nr:DUF4112 domain-containing protein [Paraglaciecola psychrophila]AGH42604.1 hypothetical protein C427_0494 [Paraglaciecola psychrophila 170]GAC36062.1 hypothetical protein GPSY_0420 [Paraglaciecola psychrophila 170]
MNQTPQAPKALLRAQKLANLTDSKVRIPFIGVRLGLDFLIGLIPVIGDVIMVGVSLSIVAMAKSIQVPRALRLAMLKNIGIDFLLGLIPFVGDVVDLFYKSNQKNVRIMEKWWVRQNHQQIQSNSQQAVQDWEKSQDS